MLKDQKGAIDDIRKSLVWAGIKGTMQDHHKTELIRSQTRELAKLEAERQRAFSGLSRAASETDAAREKKPGDHFQEEIDLNIARLRRLVIARTEEESELEAQTRAAAEARGGVDHSSN